MSERIIERTLTISAPRGQVFRALMDPGSLSRWLFATVSMTPETGSAFTFEWKDSPYPATAQGEILELVPDERLVLSWFMEADGVTSTASFDLSDAGRDQTVLKFVHSSLPQHEGWQDRFQRVALEWDKVLLNLQFLLEERGEGKHLFYLRWKKPLRAVLPRLHAAWTTSAGLASWLAKDVFVIPEEGEKLTGVTLDTGATLSARFTRIERNHHLRFSWIERGIKGLLGVSFIPLNDGVVLTITLRSFDLMEGERPIITALWDKRFARLEEYLERQPLKAEPAGPGSFRHTKRYEATPSRVWNAFTDAALLRKWFATWTDFEPRVEAPYTFLWESYGEIQGRVREAVPRESLRFTWDIPELGATTLVALRFLPVRDQPGLCEVELEHSGWGEGPEWDMQRSAYESGWAGMLAMLEFYLRRGAGKEMQSFHLRRKLPLPLDRAVSLLTTAQGMRSWLAAGATVEPKVGAPIEFQIQEGSKYKGTVVAAHSTGDLSAELDEPEPAFLEWGFAPDPDGSRLGVSYTTYDAGEEVLEGRRLEWRRALERLRAKKD